MSYDVSKATGSVRGSTQLRIEQLFTLQALFIYYMCQICDMHMHMIFSATSILLNEAGSPS